MTKPVSQAPRAPEAVANPDDLNPSAKPAPDAEKASKRPREIGGPSGLEPTRYGDWERNGRVSDF
ncbi:MAG TPA: DUF1674 domain-containing protein [Dongiaceae bacterium]|jgi:hypothetical protein|nr:DUF1674 domain-containing protein [Dongiaceae bacterium]